MVRRAAAAAPRGSGPRLCAALAALLPKPPARPLGLADVLERIARAAARRAAAAAIVQKGGLHLLRSALLRGVHESDLEAVYYAVRALEGLVLSDERPRRTLCRRLLAATVRAVEWCGSGEWLEMAEEAYGVGRHALSLLSLLLDGTAAGQVAFWLSGSAALIRALCLLATVWVPEEGEESLGSGTPFEADNLALGLLSTVLEECGWRAEDPLRACPEPYVGIALALATQRTVRAAQLLRRIGLRALAAERAAVSSAAGRRGWWPSAAVRRRRVREAVRLALAAPYPSDPQRSAATVTPPGPHSTGATASQRDNGVDLTERLTAALSTAIPPEQGYPEADYATSVATQPAEVVWSSPAGCRGNGVATLTRHGDWLALRFNAVEQGLVYCPLPSVRVPDKLLWCRPEVVGFEYVRVQCAAGLAFLAALGLPLAPSAAPPRRHPVLVVGLGTAALPAFLALSPALDVQVCEVDAAVLAVVAAHLPAPPPFGVAAADAAEWIGQGQPRGTAAAIFLDPYDALGHIPARVRTRAFFRACAAALSPKGVIVANVFNGPRGTPAGTALARFVAALIQGFGGEVTLFSVAVERRPSNLVLVALRSLPPGGVTRAALTAALEAALRGTLARSPPPPWPWRARELLSAVQCVALVRPPDGAPYLDFTPVSDG